MIMAFLPERRDVVVRRTGTDARYCVWARQLFGGHHLNRVAPKIKDALVLGIIWVLLWKLH
jgi:hypothetical protein